MKVLLIQPPMVLNKNEMLQFVAPLGLAYMGSVLREHGYTVEILDSIILRPHGQDKGNHIHLGLDWATIRDRIDKCCPDIVGISSMFTAQAECMHQMAGLVKGINRDIVTIVGGAHPSVMPEETMRDINIDFVVIGEGEKTILDLVERLSNSSHLEEIDGIAYRKGNKTIIRPTEGYIEELDELPFPAWDLLEMKEYAKLEVGHGPLVKRKPLFSIVTSRGCPGRCVFCAVHSVFGNKWRARSPKNVVDEMEFLSSHYGINQFDFEDDNLLADKKRMIDICDGIIQRKLDICWATPNGVQIDLIDNTLLTKMKQSGCFSLSFAIESGNEYIRNSVIKKPISLDHAKEVIEWCKDLNIWANGFFILGLPGENVETFRETIDVAKRLDLDSSSFFIAIPFPGTELFTICQKEGYIEEAFDFSKLKISDATIRTGAFSPEHLILWRKRAYREFGCYFLKRELLYLRIIKRLFKLRSWYDIQLFYRMGIRFLRLVL